MLRALEPPSLSADGASIAAPAGADDDLSRPRFRAGLGLVLLLAAVLRAVFPTADPPWRATVGIVWHDEGAWTHNARNRALWGTWRTDEWNPMFIAPVFTGLEYVSFAAFGVGLRQARLVSEVMGWSSVLVLALGVAQLGGRRTGLAAGGLLAANYVYVMYDRAALMEASMVALITASWWSFVRAAERPRWGGVAGLLAFLAYFAKAAAVFYVLALAAVAVACVIWRRDDQETRRLALRVDGWSALPLEARAGLLTLAGLLVAGLVAFVLFVGPHWSEYWDYNVRVSITRKPLYTVRALLDRASWYPIVHDFFTRQWLLTVTTVAALASFASRWRRLMAAEWLLHAWVWLGSAELVLHDVGNERRLVFLIPAMVALSTLLLLRDRRLLPLPAASRVRAALFAPLIAYGLYMVWGPLVRLAAIYEIRPGVRLAALLAALSTVALIAAWPAMPRWLARHRWAPLPAATLVGLLMAGDLAQFAQWAAGRSYANYEAMVALGQRLEAGTLVHGKLANGLALESTIRPVFVGRDFGNYADRLRRDDIRYVLTYTTPVLGYEGPVIREVVEAYPNRRILWTFDVRETSGGQDRAALIEKQPSSSTRAQY